MTWGFLHPCRAYRQMATTGRNKDHILKASFLGYIPLASLERVVFFSLRSNFREATRYKSLLVSSTSTATITPRPEFSVLLFIMKIFCQGFLLLSFSLVSSMAQMHGTGDLFNFVPGLGACGNTNNSEQIVASVSTAVFSKFPGATANPNKNPICQHKILIVSGKKNVTASIVDFFASESKNDANNVGLSSSGFDKFANESDGIVPNVTWSII
ncbi:hypothetical protein BJ912DRAFT_605139 [Pholiota molesta]|nr:hypothetical protein BJ912DRAFT_605139 [Pholiota molesta]